MAGLQGLSKDAMAGLQQGLAGQSAPPNPATPKNRTDDADVLILDLQRIRRACDVARDHVPDGDPRELLIGGVHACFTRLLSHIELSDAVDVLLERLFPLSSPQLKQRLQAMFAPISPTAGLAAGAQGASPNQGPAGGATGLPPGGAPQGPPMPGDAGPPA